MVCLYWEDGQEMWMTRGGMRMRISDVVSGLVDRL